MQYVQDRLQEKGVVAVPQIPRDRLGTRNVTKIVKEAILLALQLGRQCTCQFEKQARGMRNAKAISGMKQVKQTSVDFCRIVCVTQSHVHQFGQHGSPLAPANDVRRPCNPRQKRQRAHGAHLTRTYRALNIPDASCLGWAVLHNKQQTSSSMIHTSWRANPKLKQNFQKFAKITEK